MQIAFRMGFISRDALVAALAKGEYGGYLQEITERE